MGHFLELDENTESESDQLQPPKQVKVKRKSGSSEVLDVLNQYIEDKKKAKKRGIKGKNANA